MDHGRKKIPLHVLNHLSHNENKKEMTRKIQLRKEVEEKEEEEEKAKRAKRNR